MLSVDELLKMAHEPASLPPANGRSGRLGVMPERERPRWRRRRRCSVAAGTIGVLAVLLAPGCSSCTSGPACRRLDEKGCLTKGRQIEPRCMAMYRCAEPNGDVCPSGCGQVPTCGSSDPSHCAGCAKLFVRCDGFSKLPDF